MYTMTYSGVLKKDGVVIPLDDSLPAYQEYAAWLAEGNGPTMVEDDEPIYPRIQITVWQLLQALAQAGRLEQVDAAATASSNLLVRLGWQRAPTYYSDDPVVLQLSESIGMSRADLQNIFELASSF